MKRSPPFSLSDYWHVVGTDNVASVLKAAKVELKYARQIKTGLKRPGGKTALALLDAARKVTPGYEPNLELMIRGASRVGQRARKIMASPEFKAVRKSARK